MVSGGRLKIFVLLIKVIIIYKIYNMYFVESQKRCDFYYS